MTEYSIVFDKFLRKIEDVDLANFNEEDQTAMLTGWLNDAIDMLTLESPTLNHDITDKDDLTHCFNQDLDSYETELIARFMVVAWYEPKVNSLQHIILMSGSSGEKWTDQNNHLKALIYSRDTAFDRARKLIRNKNYFNNEYFEG